MHRIEQRGNGSQNGEETLAQTMHMIDEILAADDTPVLGLGLGAPGVIVPSTGVVRNAVNLGWYDVPVRTLLEARYDLPVYVVNDSHAAALAEYTFGGERESDNLILLKVSQGIGAGIILGGRPFYGDGYGAGEIGHLVVQADGSRCTCGNHGCLETIAGTRAILRRAGEALQYAGIDAAATELTWPEFSQRHTAGESAVGGSSCGDGPLPGRRPGRSDRRLQRRDDCDCRPRCGRGRFPTGCRSSGSSSPRPAQHGR